MTIAAAFVCSDGIVVGADTEYSNEVAKVYRSKIWCSQSGDCVIAAAGDEVLMKEAAETLLAKLDADRTSEDVKDAFTETMQALYHQHINASLDPNFMVQVLVAARTKDGLVLFRQSNTAVTDERRFLCIGTGESFGNYVGDRLFGDGSKPRSSISGCITVAHLLQLAKRYVYGCGGTRSDIYVLPAKGWAYQQSQANVARLEAFFDGIDGVLTPLLLAIPDPYVDLSGVKERLRVFEESVEATRPFPFDLTVQITGVSAVGFVGQLLAVVVEPTKRSESLSPDDLVVPPNPEDPKRES